MAGSEYFRQTRLDDAVLEQWVEAGWLVAHETAAGQRFADVDIARACLIRDLRSIGVNDDGIPIILDLVDQLHGLRQALREVLLTMKSQRQQQNRP